MTILNKGLLKTVESIGEGMTYLAKELRSKVAIYNHETGLSFSINGLKLGESLLLRDEEGSKITVTRIG